mgnify:CR=1 FL=1
MFYLCSTGGMSFLPGTPLNMEAYKISSLIRVSFGPLISVYMTREFESVNALTQHQD